MTLQTGPDSTLRPVVTFLNHGILPFVGREGEVAAVLDFWRGSMGEPTPTAMLVSAGAGMGKSRLADEIVLRVERESGAAIHLRLYPDSSLSLVPLLSAALGRAATRQQLAHGVSNDPAENIPLLRRLTHLRPTLLVLEDIHLLAGTPLRELQEMLQSIRDLPLAILFLSRPLELPTRGVIEPWLVREMQLKGIGQADVALLLKDIFDLADAGDVAFHLFRATLGSPLAIRSALRAAVTAGALEHLPNGSWRIAPGITDLAASLDRGVHLLTEGMVAHLDPEERRSAEELAELGEVFSLETARAVLDDAGRAVDTLLFRGILFSLELPVSPLLGSSNGGSLLAFSHTLLHRHLLDRTTLDPAKVIAAIAAGHPFYSPGVIDALRRMEEPIPDRALVAEAIDRLLRAAHRIDNTTDWEIAAPLRATAEALLDVHRPVWEPAFVREMELPIFHSQVTGLRREEGSKRYDDMLDRLLRATEGELSAELRQYRISALRHRHSLQHRRGEITLDQSWEHVESLLCETPGLRFTPYYLFYLRFVVDRVIVNHDMAMARRAEERFEEIVASGRLDPELHRFARIEILSKLLWVIDSTEELERRLLFMAEMDAGPERNNPRFNYRKITLLLMVGRIDELAELLDEWIPRFDALGLPRNAAQSRMIAITERAAFGEDLLEIAARVRELVEASPEALRSSVESNAFIGFTGNAILQGAPRIAREWRRDPNAPGGIIEFEARLLIALAADPEEAEREIRLLLSDESEKLRSESLGRASFTLASVLYGTGDIPIEHAIEQTRSELAAPIVRLRELLRTHAILSLLAMLENAGRKEIVEELRQAIKMGLEIAMTWLDERGLNGYMIPFITRHRQWWTRRQAEACQARAQQIDRERQARRQKRSSNAMLRISMLGRIEAIRPDGEIVQIRGGRLRVLAGVLVADRMLSHPLGHREFCRIASGEEDPERARKTMNGAVMRLREALGDDAIDTSGETPRLDLRIVSVDLLDAFELCGRGADAIRGGLPAGALPRVRQALDIWNGEVPFPALYESFFEAAREDFENRIATTTVAVARALLAEDDPSGAEELLRRAVAMLPGEETLAELLIEALERCGRKADAERLRITES